MSVQAGSLESIICVCANHGQRQRIQRLVRDPRLDDADIHPAARADISIYLQDRHALAAVLLRSAAARLYVCSLNPSHSDLDLVEWAQDFCIAIETQAASCAVLPLPLNLKETP
ncbi:hypothetical protein [Xylophilus sp. GOD-11R]|uniref:hypothetical protein n=1 Tax=Xylophilus sp. GOD-11R TaxID=3089814 RepID=UPI00298C59BA|nr:hypothetical protein [Xylophilus sp. GOD-11R]WPB57373.1 hypothetical protein R9X41_01590 [Xylophilus sp. GOD-11R]